MPAFDEEATIVVAVHSLLRVDVPDFELLFIDDGSSDSTLSALTEAFDLQPFPDTVRRLIPTAEVELVLRSPTYPQLRVLRKQTATRRMPWWS